jgi:hypothetical protein
MCYEYYEQLQRREDQRSRELLELHKRQTERDLERTKLEREEWELPEEPARTREEVPA